jgi:23S rRNA (adenine-N6)-dimethyltransferase
VQSGRGNAGGGSRGSADRRFSDRPHHSNATAGGRRRNLSQNFLADRRAAVQFVDACRLEPGDWVAEVGAGTGLLTELIAHRVANLTAFEPDTNLAGKLRRATEELGNVDIVFDDVLTGSLPAGVTKLAGNIPFGRTADLIRWTLDQDVEAATYITQLEYARKRTGHRGRWSQLTIETWPWLDWQLGPRISRTAFRPVPAVDAAVLQLTFRDQPLLSAEQLPVYQAIVGTGFKGVGGTLFRSLQALYRSSELTAAFGLAGLDREVVVAFVPPEAWLTLAVDLSRPREQLSRPPSRPGAAGAVRRRQARRPGKAWR